MKDYIFLLVFMITAVILNGCNNSTSTTATANDSLTAPDSVNIAGKDHTSAAKDSGIATNTAPVDTADKVFIRKAASGGMLEVDLGNLSEKNGVSPRVKHFGEMMIKDHTDANANLKNIALQLHVDIPGDMLPEHLHHEKELAAKKGSAFDKAYMKMMVEDHKEDIAAFEKAAKSNNDIIKNFATQTLPVLTKHLDSANAIVRGGGR